jgi:dTDP-4-dehydro-6-deoxy-alpha-D-glucopyranose 2,3-dehydratase
MSSVSPLSQEKKILDWYESRLKYNTYDVKVVPLAKLKEWFYDHNNGYLVHKSGSFFSIRGLKVNTNFGNVNNWSQPIINQPEIGILGIITKQFNGVRKYLIQAKMEPGNVNLVQLSPTVQATRSNYTQVHKGKKTPYLEYFIKQNRSKVLVDRIQYEQGGRFFNKINRNILVEIEDDLEVSQDFIWMSPGEIAYLLSIDNMINMNSRSVFSCFLRDDNSDLPLFSTNEILNWLSKHRALYSVETSWIPLDELEEWIICDESIFHRDNKYFSIIGVEVIASNREVTNWSQPILHEPAKGLSGFVIKEINGTQHYLVRAVVEAGKRTINLGPTVQCSDYHNKKDEIKYLDLFLSNDNKITYDKIQSEEGGRFYQFQNRNIIIELDYEIKTDDHYIWMSHNQVLNFISYGYFNIEARTLMTCWNSIKNKGSFTYD